MSHTTHVADEWWVIHNGGWDGMAQVVHNDDVVAELPGEILLLIGLEAFKSEAMSRIEDAFDGITVVNQERVAEDNRKRREQDA